VGERNLKVRENYLQLDYFYLQVEQIEEKRKDWQGPILSDFGDICKVRNEICNFGKDVCNF